MNQLPAPEIMPHPAQSVLDGMRATEPGYDQIKQLIAESALRGIGHIWKWTHEKRKQFPPLGKPVLLRVAAQCGTPCICIGYSRHPAGDRKQIVFRTPGIVGQVLAWDDVLPDNYDLREAFKWAS